MAGDQLEAADETARQQRITELASIRASLKSRLTRFITHIENPRNLENIPDLRERFSKIDPCLDEFEIIQTEYEKLTFSAPNAEQINDEYRLNVETNYYKITSIVRPILKHADIVDPIVDNGTCNSFPSVNSNLNNGLAQVKLPTIELPKYSGSFLSWTSFHDNFISLIHNNDSLTNVQKLHYLKSCLSGEALRTIESLATSDDNYAIALQQLRDRYENKRLICHHHLKSLFNLPQVQKDSSKSLRLLLDTFTANLKVLTLLKRPVKHWDDLIIYLIVSTLDLNTKREWENTLQGLQANVIPTLVQMIEFLNNRCQMLEALEFGSTSNNNNKTEFKSSQNNRKSNYSRTTHLATNNQPIICILCKNSHKIFSCPDLLKLEPSERLNIARERKLCVNCLRDNHVTKNCRSPMSCKNCNKRHNTLLHLNNSTIASEPRSEPSTSNSSNVSYFNHAHSEVLLSTALILVKDKQNKWQQCRALLDVGSQSHFITKTFLNQLGLVSINTNMSISGINQTTNIINQSVIITLKSRINSYTKSIHCLVLEKITQNLPLYTFQLDRSSKPPKNIPLADPSFNISGPIDLLIGAELFWQLISVGQIKQGGEQQLYFQKTLFGWTAGGVTSGSQSNKPSSSYLSINKLDTRVSRFLDLESMSETEVLSSNLSQDDLSCEKHFMHNYKRDESGRFIVKLPLKEDSPGLGLSRPNALNRFLSVERKLKKPANKNLKIQYCNFMNECLELNHMELVPNGTEYNDGHKTFYLPHHAVFKESSLTTKLRVVYDGSAVSSSGLSLNEILYKGPPLQQDLFLLLLRFRSFKYILCSDITKMFRQVIIAEEDRDFQRILWRDDSTDEIKTYRLTRVTYGTASGSYLAIKSMQQLAEEEKHKYPLASKIIKRDFYVDDLLTGSNDYDEAVAIRDQVKTVLKSGGFELCKWASNCAELLPKVDDELSKSGIINLDRDSDIKTLGLNWDSNFDKLKYSIKPTDLPRRVTKRIILSTISRLFDPLGLLGPIIIKSKILMQKIWSLKLSWDETIPHELHSEWLLIMDQLTEINNINIPRNVTSCPVESELEYVEIHGFCDASQSAYGSCIYIRAKHKTTDAYHTQLLCAKSRVAPLKVVLTLPRLELNGAVLLTRLLKRVIQALDIKIDKVYCWTDSTIVLAWLAAPANKWKTFVANRISEIQGSTNVKDWNHVKSASNPADIISRGLLPNEMQTCNLWWHGPSFLKENFQNSLINQESITDLNNADLEVEQKRACFLATKVNDTLNLLTTKFSSLLRTLRVTATCLRFIKNLKSPKNKIITNLTINEINIAETMIIKYIQSQSFGNDIQQLNSEKPINKLSKILALNPFLDEFGILRVGGRIQNADLSFDQKHPILVPRNHHLTKLIIIHEHKEQLHAGPTATLAAVRNKFWPLSGRSITRLVLHKCVTCFKVKPTKIHQLMGTLPKSRVEQCRPFLTTGIDYAGPIFISDSKLRNKKIVKAYIALFVCFATKAIHLELVGDCTTSSFLNCLKRFISRRGCVKTIYSDNASTFIGANKELDKIFKSLEFSKLVIDDYLTKQKISWNFIPPRSPHFGGLWEIGIKSCKSHLKRVIKDTHLTYEAMYTVLTTIEACLNSRPITQMSSDPNDLMALTPSHFLIGDILTAPVERDLTNTPINRLSLYQRIEQIKQHFWKRWHKEYMNQLQQRPKWTTDGPTLKLGQLVLIHEDNAPPLKWPVGRIIDLHPGQDGRCRVISIKTASGVYKRAVAKISVLPVYDKSDT